MYNHKNTFFFLLIAISLSLSLILIHTHSSPPQSFFILRMKRRLPREIWSSRQRFPLSISANAMMA